MGSDVVGHGALEAIRGQLIVSCQAREGEPLGTPDVLTRMAHAVIAGGAGAVRIEGLANVSAVASSVSVPVVGLWKDGDNGVYITPTLRHATQIASAGADVIALDGTQRTRPDGLTLAETVTASAQSSTDR